MSDEQWAPEWQTGPTGPLDHRKGYDVIARMDKRTAEELADSLERACHPHSPHRVIADGLRIAARYDRENDDGDGTVTFQRVKVQAGTGVDRSEAGENDHLEAQKPGGGDDYHGPGRGLHDHLKGLTDEHGVLRGRAGGVQYGVLRGRAGGVQYALLEQIAWDWAAAEGIELSEAVERIGAMLKEGGEGPPVADPVEVSEDADGLLQRLAEWGRRLEADASAASTREAERIAAVLCATRHPELPEAACDDCRAIVEAITDAVRPRYATGATMHGPGPSEGGAGGGGTEPEKITAQGGFSAPLRDSLPFFHVPAGEVHYQRADPRMIYLPTELAHRVQFVAGTDTASVVLRRREARKAHTVVRADAALRRFIEQATPEGFEHITVRTEAAGWGRVRLTATASPIKSLLNP